MNTRSRFAPLILCALLLAASGCQKSDDGESQSRVDLPESLFLAEAPTGVAAVATLKETAQEGDAVTIRAVVGGTLKTFVADRAVMTVIDEAVTNPCLAEGHNCAAPWDYCCTPPEQRLQHMASVRIVDAGGRPLAVDLKGVDQVRPLSTLIIQGTVGPRPDPATLVIHANGIFVESQG